MPKIAFYTLGCKVNQSDTNAMAKLFQDAGYEIVPFEEPAEVYLINTCVVTNTGQSKSRKIIHRAVKQALGAVVVVTGCYPQTAPEEVKHIAGVDLIVGNQDRGRIVTLVEQARSNKKGELVNAVHQLAPGSCFEELAVPTETIKTRAFLKIQEGCNQFCAYCIIPYARGPLRSRSLENITQEVTALVAAGYQEIVLIGIHLGAYGHETGGKTTLASAVKAALAVPGLTRLRLGSLESVEVEDELLATMAQDTRLCPHLHLPLQAGSDKILRAMHRPYDTKKFTALLAGIRAKLPEIAITTDVIVGFPGETQEDFISSLAFIQSCKFSKIHIFPYSKRHGTPAAIMPEQVPENIKKERAACLAELDIAGHRAFCQTMVGEKVSVLIETRNAEGLWEGLAPNYVRVFVDKQQELAGKIIQVNVKKLYSTGVFGVIIENNL